MRIHVSTLTVMSISAVWNGLLSSNYFATLYERGQNIILFN